MKKAVSADELEIGMFVELKGNWLSHPFARNSFRIRTEKELHKVREFFATVMVDFERSEQRLCSGRSAIVQSNELPAVDEWQRKNTPSQDLVKVLQADCPAEEKSQAIFQHSIKLMENLLANEPTAELIQESAEPLKQLAECVIHEQDIATTLLSITSHDYYTYTHCVNVGMKGLLIARHIMGVSDELLLKELSVGFFLHDIGKSKVDSAILNKPGRLSPEEAEIMRSHPERGVQILQQADSLTEAARIITLQHHEKADGSGYPYGLRGNEIHQFSQICALADIYDALTAERSYKKGMPVYDALRLMKDKMSHHFDDWLFKGFLDLFVSHSRNAKQMNDAAKMRARSERV